MNRSRTATALAVLSLLAVCPTEAQEQRPAVTMKHVKYDGLKEVVLANRGKVVLVDFWGFY